MKTFFLLTAYLLLSHRCHAQFDQLDKKIDELVDQCNYQKALTLLNKEAANNKGKKNWMGWAHIQAMKGQLYVELGLNDSTLASIKKIEHVISKFSIQNKELNCKLFQLKYHVYAVNGDFSNWKKYLDKSFSLKKSCSSTKAVDFIPYYFQYCHYYQTIENQEKAQYYLKKSRELVQLHEKEMQKNTYIDFKTSLLNFQIGENLEKFFSTGTLQNYEPVKKELYSFLPQQKNSRLKSMLCFTIGSMYFNDAIQYQGTGDPKIEKIISAAASMFDQAILLCKAQSDDQSMTIATMLTAKSYLYQLSTAESADSLRINCYVQALHSLIPKFENKITNFTSDINLGSFEKYNLLLENSFSLETFLSENEKNKSRSINDLRRTYHLSELNYSIYEKLLTLSESKSFFEWKKFTSFIPLKRFITDQFKIYAATKNKKYIRNTFEYAEKSKYYLLLSKRAELAAKQKKTERIKRNTQLRIENIQKKHLPKDGCLIEYVRSEWATYAILISKNSFDVVDITDKMQNFAQRTTQLKEAIEKSDIKSFKHLSHQLYGSLIAPLISKIPKNIKKLIIIPDDAIAFVPFEALLTRKTEEVDYRRLPYLINKYQISYKLSFLVDYKLTSKKQLSIPILGIAPGKIKGMNILPYSVKSVEKIQEKYDGTFLYKSDATKKNFLQKAPKANVIFLASHAEGDIDNLENSIIYLHKNKKDNGKLTLKDIYRSKLNAELVVLSACETNLGKSEYGEGIIGFERAFMYAGCESVLSTLWHTDDQANYEILTSFMNNLNEEEPKSTTLLRVQKNYLKNAKSSEDANPIYWAGFRLVGSQKLETLPSKSNTYFLLVIGFSTLFGGLLWIFVRKKKKKTATTAF
jgi:LPXTG-motif cell wall-anchored protein